MNITIGTCSLCGGRVTVPKVWASVVPAIPTCESCGATKKQPHGSVVEMERPMKADPLPSWLGGSLSGVTPESGLP